MAEVHIDIIIVVLIVSRILVKVYRANPGLLWQDLRSFLPDLTSRSL